MTRLAGHLLRLWMNPLPDGDAALAAFREVYADPVRVNGIDMPVEELVQRARALHVAFDQLGVKVDQQVEVSGVLVIGFRMRGRHVGRSRRLWGRYRRRGAMWKFAPSTS